MIWPQTDQPTTTPESGQCVNAPRSTTRKAIDGPNGIQTPDVSWTRRRIQSLSKGSARSPKRMGGLRGRPSFQGRAKATGRWPRSRTSPPEGRERSGLRPTVVRQLFSGKARLDERTQNLMPGLRRWRRVFQRSLEDIRSCVKHLPDLQVCSRASRYQAPRCAPLSSPQEGEIL
jgi:hypothetical protein